MSEKSRNPYERYGAKVIDNIKDYLMEVGGESAAKALPTALTILLQTNEKAAKISITFSIEEFVTRHGELAMRVDGETKVSGKLQTALQPTEQKFVIDENPLPGLEGV